MKRSIDCVERKADGSVASEQKRKLIIVGCHGVYKNETKHYPLDYTLSCLTDPRSWKCDVKDDVPYLFEHILTSLELLQRNPSAMLILSGGATKNKPERLETTEQSWKPDQIRLSEARSYFNIIRNSERWLDDVASYEAWCNAHFPPETFPALRQRIEDVCLWLQSDQTVWNKIHLEEYATDSFTNLTKSVGEYYCLAHNYPEKVFFVSWPVKESRFYFHKWTIDCCVGRELFDFEFVSGVKTLDASRNEDRMKREQRVTRDRWFDFPLGSGLLKTKRQGRKVLVNKEGKPKYTDLMSIAVSKMRKDPNQEGSIREQLQRNYPSFFQSFSSNEQTGSCHSAVSHVGNTNR